MEVPLAPMSVLSITGSLNQSFELEQSTDLSKSNVNHCRLSGNDIPTGISNILCAVIK